jgi:inorganic pyrophosphatase
VMQIDVTIEIPKGTRNKYEADSDGVIWLDRMLFTATRYPDPIDALVLLDEPTFPGCHIHARPVAVFMMSDEKGVDEKLLCVPAGDPRFAHVVDVGDVSSFKLDEIAHFFKIYKDLEPNKHTEPGAWEGREAAEARYEAAVRRHREQ